MNHLIKIILSIIVLTSQSQAMEDFVQPDLIHFFKSLIPIGQKSNRFDVSSTISSSFNQQQKEITELLKIQGPIKIEVTNDKGFHTPKKGAGFNFPSSPCHLLSAAIIKMCHEASAGKRIPIGDWGCGHGYFTRHAIFSGGNPYAIDLSMEALQEARKITWKANPFLQKLNLNFTDTCKLFAPCSITNPHPSFMARQNYVNVSSNVLHYLKPTDADIFLKKLYENTMNGGYVIMSCDTPFSNAEFARMYRDRLASGHRYPGFSIQNNSNIEFLDTGEKLTMLRSLTFKSEEEVQDLEMGTAYRGSVENFFWKQGDEIIDDSKKVIRVKDVSCDHPMNFLRTKRPYECTNFYHLFNQLDHVALERILSDVGFRTLYTGYSDRDTIINTEGIEVIIVAQKPE